MRHSIGALGMLTSAPLAPQSLSRSDDASLLVSNPQPLPPSGDGSPAALNPQPLPPVEKGAWTTQQMRRLELRGVRAVAWVPGFAGRDVALADIGEDGHLLLDLSRDKVRVAGTLIGPFGPLDTSRHFAFAAAGRHVMVFNRLEAPVPVPGSLADRRSASLKS
jgi:hypothetical protein